MKKALGISVWGKMDEPQKGCDIYLDTWKSSENKEFLNVEMFDDRKKAYLRKAVATIHLSPNTVKRLIELLEEYLPKEEN